MMWFGNILFLEKEKENHYDYLKMVFEQLLDNQRFASPGNCRYLNDEIDFLGRLIIRTYILVESEKVNILEQFRRPKWVTDTSSFVEFLQFFRCFIS